MKSTPRSTTSSPFLLIDKLPDGHGLQLLQAAIRKPLSELLKIKGSPGADRRAVAWPKNYLFWRTWAAATIYFTGCRPGQLAALSSKHWLLREPLRSDPVGWPKHAIILTLPPHKRGYGRRIPITDQHYFRMTKLAINSRRSDQPLYPGCYRSIYRAIRALSGHRVSPRALRHNFATWWIQQTRDARLVQYLLGHSDINSTMIYVSVDTQAILRGALDHAQITSGGKMPVRVTIKSDTAT
ncbi:MAG: site-specific integrase [Deltaproteobacteria bacterium]|nr:site-specific integrase [Deltaproteobacteria bacterium]